MATRNGKIRAIRTTVATAPYRSRLVSIPSFIKMPKEIIANGDKTNAATTIHTVGFILFPYHFPRPL